VKHHLVLTLRTRLPDDLRIPDWLTFVGDKSVIREDLEPDVDRLLDDAGARFWVTREYRPAGPAWNADEIRQRLDRTYRLILQHDYRLPPDLLDRIRLVPAVEDVRELEVGDAPIPAPALSHTTSAGRSAGDLIHLDYAKALTRGSPDVTVAVLDTGADLDHPELRGRIAKQADFVDLHGLDVSDFIGDLADYDNVPEDEVGHGTHVAGIIAGRGERMDEGVAPDCRIMAVRVLATMRKNGRLCGAGVVDNINPAIKFAVDSGADIINMSLGIRHSGGGLPHEDVIRYAVSKGVTVVAASGNDGTNNRYYPGALPGVIAVGAVDAEGSVTSFTSYGAPITVVAPGVNIYSSFANRSYAVASGTSQASPFVAGSVALMKSYASSLGTTLGHLDVVDVLRRTSDKVDSRLRDERAGYGLLNLADAFKHLTYSLN
jgi:subtilisin family serine protease